MLMNPLSGEQEDQTIKKAVKPKDVAKKPDELKTSDPATRLILQELSKVKNDLKSEIKGLVLHSDHINILYGISLL